ncbi:hypothetical protein IAI10_19870 [Clostridium sp. 19966]|uniref:hypothetical protein n=1 Tax=Clostridium sp. 19966 TaxID=2768166 RepID=UPI0028DFF6F6|nr:hypothetical protein [Clostridium sp. 19966]MDT8718913.1 hypothetical protein [Clostridium sp. 19966]
MNISSVLNSSYSNNISSKQVTKADVISSATKAQHTQAADAISSATKSNGGDHYFEARA